ncbi:MAG: hypothetical protein Q4A75_01995 [Peptostreptococcaceae bacterium]|nr:hypothetical protein [Peptostreptococcaceae bacterium]
MDKKSTKDKNISTDKLDQLIEENQNLKAIVKDYTDLKNFAEEVVEKHNSLVLEYKSRQTDLTEAKEIERSLREQLVQKDEEIKRLKDLSEKLEKRLVDFQNHINNLLDRFQSIEEENKKHEATIMSLERYIEIMDQPPKRIKNERGAGRKKKYKQEQIDYIVRSRLDGIDYEVIVAEANEKFPSRTWSIPEIKYIFNRYKKV